MISYRQADLLESMGWHDIAFVATLWFDAKDPNILMYRGLSKISTWSINYPDLYNDLNNKVNSFLQSNGFKRTDWDSQKGYTYSVNIKDDKIRYFQWGLEMVIEQLKELLEKHVPKVEVDRPSKKVPGAAEAAFKIYIPHENVVTADLFDTMKQNSPRDKFMVIKCFPNKIEFHFQPSNTKFPKSQIAKIMEFFEMNVEEMGRNVIQHHPHYFEWQSYDINAKEVLKVSQTIFSILYAVGIGTPSTLENTVKYPLNDNDIRKISA